MDMKRGCVMAAKIQIKDIHVGRRDDRGARRLYRAVSRKVCVGGKCDLGELIEDWCQNQRHQVVTGWYWMTLDGSVSKTFPLMRDAVADFVRELNDRQRRNNNKESEAK